MEISAPGSNGSDLVKDTTTPQFTQDVIEASKSQPVLVDFWAPWCGPCRQLTPMIESAVQRAAGRVKLVKMNIEDHPEVAGQMGIQSIPAVVAFKDGQPADAFMGAVPESEIDAFIEKISGPTGPSPLDEALDQAEALLADFEFTQAAQIFSGVAGEDKENIRALVGLANCALGLENLEQASQIADMFPENAAEDPAVKSLLAQIALLQQAGDTSDIDPLIAAVEANPDDHQSRLDLAIALNAAGKRQDAADSLLEIMRRDRSWNDDGARTELLKFFEAWGPTDEDTKKARRKLSTILFS